MEEMEYTYLPIDEVELDLENPRIKQWVEIYKEITSEQIALALSASGSSSDATTYNSLRESIKVNKGLINPIIVNITPEGKKVVIEGNTRLQIYKEFSVTDPDGPWMEIPAVVYNNLPSAQIHAIRLQTHLVGPRDWDPFSKAKYLNQLSNVDKLPIETIISFCGGKASEIKRLIAAYTDMQEFYFPAAKKAEMDPDPREFSKFSELQNRSVIDALLTHHYDKNDFAQWVINGNIDTAQNVRQLPRVLADSTAREVFLKSNISEAVKNLAVVEKGSITLDSASMDDLVIKLIEKINTISHHDFNLLKYDVKRHQQMANLKDLQEALNDLINDIEE